MESDLVNDSKLPVRFSAKHTHHVIFESNTRAGQQVRRQRREETWEKVKHLGRGGFGSVWLEKRSRVDSQPKTRAVKAIPKSTPFSQVIDYKRELQAIAKFSHRKVCFVFTKLHDISLTLVSTRAYLSNPSGGTKMSHSRTSQWNTSNWAIFSSIWCSRCQS
jgi:serine/threonine protein kinase